MSFLNYFWQHKQKYEVPIVKSTIYANHFYLLICINAVYKAVEFWWSGFLAFCFVYLSLYTGFLLIRKCKVLGFYLIIIERYFPICIIFILFVEYAAIIPNALETTMKSEFKICLHHPCVKVDAQVHFVLLYCHKRICRPAYLLLH